MFLAPTPASSQNILGTLCKVISVNGTYDENTWFYSRGEGACNRVDMHYFSLDTHQQAYEVVYTFQVYNLQNYIQLVIIHTSFKLERFNKFLFSRCLCLETACSLIIRDGSKI